MSDNIKKEPAVRFSGFTDAWEQRKLGELLKSAYQGINTAGDKVIYSEKGVEILQSKHITSGYITFDDTRFLDKKRYSEYFPKYVPKKHDILFANIGTIGPSTVVETNKEFLIAWNILKMTPNENVNSKFIELFLQILNEKHYYEKITTGNATKFVNKDAILNIELCISSFKEQEKIGSFFKQIDDTIDLHQRELEKTKTWKKTTLSKMFPKNGENVPEIRFDGFADDWEQRELGRYVDLITKGTTPKDKSGQGTINFVKVENISDGVISPASKISVEEHEGYLQRSKLKENDILISIAGTLGRTGFVDKSILPANTNQALAIIRGYDFDKDFLLTSLNGNAVKDFIRRNPTIGAQPNLSLEQVGNFLISTPLIEEQKEIGSFFHNLDQTIAFQQRELGILKEMKKTLLHLMFI